MKRFTFYFEIFGQKKRWQCTAKDKTEAAVMFNKFLLGQVNIHDVKTESKGRKEESIFDLFGSDFWNIFLK